MNKNRNRAGFNYSQPAFDDRMDLWGESKGEEVWEIAPRKSRVLGPDGEPLEYARQKLGFDLSPRGRTC
jgi:hypothetical protein